MLPIDIATLKEGLHQVRLEAVPEDLGLEPGSFEDIVVEARLDYGNHRLFVAFEVGANAVLECDRTLKPFRQAVSGAYALLFVPEYELGQYTRGDADEVRPIPEAARELDIAEPVRDTLLLALPQRRVAPGAEDEDIPLRFGDEGRGDSRWDALRGLGGDAS